MANVPVRRDDQDAAEAVMRRNCPDEGMRRFLMAQLLRSIAVAEKAGPGSWAVTLFANGFRLNVGQVEAFTYLNRLVRFFMLGSVPANAYTVGEILPCAFRSLPQPQLAFYGSVGELERLIRLLTPAHESFLTTAATTAKGEPRKCPYSRYHSPGLYNYALRFAGALVPERSRPAKARPGTPA
jgi:hypothetical protein